MSVDIERALVFERLDPAIPGHEKLMPASALRIYSGDDGRVLLTYEEGKRSDCIVLDDEALAALRALVEEG